MDDLNKAIIAVTKLPVVEEQLQAIKARWLAKLEDAKQMVCTEETVQSLKGIRADMRKEFAEADAQRKAAKVQYMAPWNAVEATFKACVKDSFDEADGILKGMIGEYETNLKRQCYATLKTFFLELAASEGIDFLTLEQAMAMAKVNITLEDCKRRVPTRLQDAVAGVISDVAIALEDAGKMDDSAEIIAEYKQTFDLGKAVAAVQQRKKRIQAEMEAAEARRAAQERMKAAEEKVQAVMPPVETAAPVAAEPVFEEYTFTVYGCTRTQLIKIRDFLKQEGISYE